VPNILARTGFRRPPHHGRGGPRPLRACCQVGWSPTSCSTVEAPMLSTREACASTGSCHVHHPSAGRLDEATHARPLQHRLELRLPTLTSAKATFAYVRQDRLGPDWPLQYWLGLPAPHPLPFALALCPCPCPCLPATERGERGGVRREKR
jgi:hypothetical protein